MDLDIHRIRTFPAFPGSSPEEPKVPVPECWLVAGPPHQPVDTEDQSGHLPCRPYFAKCTEF
eukprot:1624449-Rhodomonas_salina.2